MEFDDMLRKTVNESYSECKGITTRVALFIWSKPEIQKKVEWGLRYFKRLTANKYNVLFTENDIKNEIYDVFSTCLLSFDYNSTTLFPSYFNNAINNHIVRLLNKNYIVEQTNFISPERDEHNDIQTILLEFGYTEEQIIKAVKTKDKLMLNTLKQKLKHYANI